MTRVVALSGGVGGSKLVLGLCRYLGEDEVSVIVNTGDDFEHLGLHVAPDIDTLMYTLSGLNNQDTGWGRADESWSFMEALGQLGGEDWFLLGDKDLATIVERTRRLRAGESLTEVTRHFAETLGVRAQILPMSDQPVRTLVLTRDGELAFQHYFVRDACQPVVTGFRFDGAGDAAPTRAVLEVLQEKTLELVVVCPSNPFISIDPDSFGAGDTRGFASRRCSNRRGVSHRRGYGGERADRENDAGAGIGAVSTKHRTPL